MEQNQNLENSGPGDARAVPRGVCVAHLGEAEALADAGIPEILITSELVGPNKAERHQ